MVLGYWSPELPSESQISQDSTWFQLNGRTDGSLHLNSSQFSEGFILSKAPETQLFPLLAFLIDKSEYSNKSDIFVHQIFNKNLNSLVEQNKADLLYPFHFYF